MQELVERKLKGEQIGFGDLKTLVETYTLLVRNVHSLGRDNLIQWWQLMQKGKRSEATQTLSQALSANAKN